MSQKGRYEIKYLITYADYIDISTKLKGFVFLDDNTGDNDEYFIRSLYFDDIYSTSYTSKINGDNDRKKYRIRIYNYLDDKILFERKEKHNNTVIKTSFPLKRFQYEQLMMNNYEVLCDLEHPLAKEIYANHTALDLKPSVVVDYDRTAFVHPLSNTRITFDKNLRAGINSFDIFNEEMNTLHIFQNDSVIMEIKYDSYLPDHLSSILSTVHGQKTALSKFCMCKNVLGHVNLKDAIYY